VTLTPDHDRANARVYTNTSSLVNIYNVEMGVNYTISVYSVKNGLLSAVPAVGRLALREYLNDQCDPQVFCRSKPVTLSILSLKASSLHRNQLQVVTRSL